MTTSKKSTGALYSRIRQILEAARSSVARSVNTTQVVSNWLVGREIVEDEQAGKARAGYGAKLMEGISAKLTRDYGSGYSVQNLRLIRQFYLMYPALIAGQEIRYAPRSELADTPISGTLQRKASDESAALTLSAILHAPRSESWKPGLLHPHLSWTL